MRRDLAHIAYAGLVFVPSYARPVLRKVIADSGLRIDQREESELLSEVLTGEVFEVLEEAQHRVWGRSPVDGAVGFLDASALGEPVANHSPAIKDARSSDPAAIAEALIGTPWRAGGRSAAGVDSSGLIYLALSATVGPAAPRFLDLQAGWGTEVPADQPPRRGDLMFHADHGSIAVSADMLVHVQPGGRVETIAFEQLIAAMGAPLARRRG